MYLPVTTPPEGRYRLLLLDGHSSHVDIEFLWTCREARVELIFLPAHATHLLQPLDLSGFLVVKSNYRNQVRDFTIYDDAAVVKKERFIQYYHLAREESFTERVIRAG